MIAQQQDEKTPDEKAALSILVDWRETDRAALANKRSRDAQRLEYRRRNDLRAAADKLPGGQP